MRRQDEEQMHREAIKEDMVFMRRAGYLRRQPVKGKDPKQCQSGGEEDWMEGRDWSIARDTLWTAGHGSLTNWPWTPVHLGRPTKLVGIIVYKHKLFQTQIKRLTMCS